MQRDPRWECCHEVTLLIIAPRINRSQRAVAKGMFPAQYLVINKLGRRTHRVAITGRHPMLSKASVCRAIALAAGIGLAGIATAQSKQFSFAYDQPKTSAYGFGADVFGKRLSELSKGTMSTNQYPGAQLGTEAQTLQKVQTGDIDFVLVSTANSSTIQPESGVFSLHFIFRD